MRSIPVALMHVICSTVCLTALAGCTRGTLELVDMDLRRVPDAEPLVERIELPESYWWEIQGGIAVAAARDPDRAAGAGPKRVDLSFAFAGMPAGHSRDYLLNTDSLRAYIRQGLAHRRFRSASGTAAIWLEPRGDLRVKFRVLARRETFHILTGWSVVGESLLLGEFKARHDAERGAAILRRSEADGMTRSSRAHIPVDPRPRPVQVIGPAVDAEANAPPVREDGPKR